MIDDPNDIQGKTEPKTGYNREGSRGKKNFGKLTALNKNAEYKLGANESPLQND
jgi:hypothetical protein